MGTCRRQDKEPVDNNTVYGPESSGKTSIALFHAAKMQIEFPTKYILFIDLEHAIDPQLIINYGLDAHRFIISQPDNGEDAFDLAEAFIRSGQFSLAILDSVAAILPKVEEEESMEKMTMGVTARLMGKALRKLTPICAEQNCTFIFINQIREKIGINYGSPEITPGGRSLQFFASIRIHIRGGEKICNPIKKDEIIGHICHAKITKNKTAPPFRTASFPLLYGVGIDKFTEMVDVVLLAPWLTKAGAWLRLEIDGTPIVRNGLVMKFQGRDKFQAYVETDPGIIEAFSQYVITGNFDMAALADLPIGQIL